MPDKAEVRNIDGSPVDYVNVRAFGREFKRLLPGNAENLLTLEREGVLYEKQFASETEDRINLYRIKLLPREIVRYVAGLKAQQEYFEALEKYDGDKDKALAAVTDREIASEVELWKHTKLRDGTEMDFRGCEASFLGKELEALICLRSHPERMELLPDVSAKDKLAVLLDVLGSISSGVSWLSNRAHGRPGYVVENEYDVQDLLYVILKPFFADARMEEFAPKHAGSAKRIDIVIPSVDIVIEVKFVRNESHAASVADEIKVDIESYHVHPNCKTLCVLVYDPQKLIADRYNFATDLSGLRILGGKEFETKVVVQT